MSIFDHELLGTTVLSIGHRAGLEAFHTRTLHLVRTCDGAMLHHQEPAQEVPDWAWWTGVEDALRSPAPAVTPVETGSAG